MQSLQRPTDTKKANNGAERPKSLTFGTNHRSASSLASAIATDVAVEAFSAFNTRFTSAHEAELIAALQRSNESVMTTPAIPAVVVAAAGSSPSSAVSEPAAAAGTGIYRHVTESTTPYESLYAKRYGGPLLSLVASFKAKCAEYGDGKTAVSWRPLASVERVQQPLATVKKGQKPKTWEMLHLAPTQHYSYRQLWEQIEALGAGLAAPIAAGGAALAPHAQIGLYAETCKEWMISCYGLWLQSYVGVTVYANLGEDALLYAIREAEMAAIICSARGARTVARICKKAGIATPALIVLPELLSEPHAGATSPAAVVSDLNAAAHSQQQKASSSSSSPSTTHIQSPTAFLWEGISKAGFAAIRDKTAATEKLPTSPDDTALIMYTSGTTGDPKGVVLSHGNIYAAVHSFDFRLKQYLAGVRPGEAAPSYVGYLPLAHILEFAAENCFLMAGATVGYGTPRTLTGATARPCGDLEEFKPMFFVGVPRIFDTILKGVEAKLPKGLAGRLFSRAYSDRLAAYDEGKLIAGYDATVFKATRATIGGRCRCVVSGGAPLSAKTQQYMSVIFGCPVVQGYGLTETCAIATVPSYWDMRTEVIGPVLPGIEMRLVDVDAWRHTDTPNPRGEIWLRGPTVTKGYYKQPQKTAEAFAPGGWLRTGDVGEMMPGGTLRIIGRVKSLAKNLNGEYIAMESLESLYVQHPLAVPNGVCVVVDSQKPFIAALVCTDEAKAMAFAKSSGIVGAQWPAVLDDPTFRAKAAASLAAVAAKSGKKKFELVERVLVLKDEWTPESGILTAAMKLKRHALETRYKAEIAALFAADGAPALPVGQPAKL